MGPRLTSKTSGYVLVVNIAVEKRAFGYISNLRLLTWMHPSYYIAIIAEYEPLLGVST